MHMSERVANNYLLHMLPPLFYHEIEFIRDVTGRQPPILTQVEDHAFRRYLGVLKSLQKNPRYEMAGRPLDKLVRAAETYLDSLLHPNAA